MDIVNEYLDPTTSPERKEAIRKEIEANGNEDAKILIQLKESMDLAPELDQFKAQLNRLEHKPSRLTPIRIAASIAFLCLVSIMAFFVSERGEPSAQKLFETHFFPYDGYTFTRSAEDKLIFKGIEAYESNDFERALKQFLSIDVQDNAELNLLISSCYLKLDNTSEALIFLNRIGNTQNNLLTNNRDWYLALTYLAQGDIQKCEQLLQQIVESGSPFQSNAEDLLESALFEDVPIRK